MNFDLETASALWDENPENAINLFDNQSKKTEAITLNGYFKIPTNTNENTITAIHGKLTEGTLWPRDYSFSYRSSVLLSV